MNKLPVGWRREKLGLLGKMGSGGTPLSSVRDYYHGKIKWAIIADLNEGILCETKNSITEKGLKASSAKIVPKDSLLIGMYGSIGKTAITGCELATNQAIAFIVPNTDIMDVRFLKYFIQLNVGELFKLSKGGTQKNISQEILRNLELPVPPVPEQRKILSEIEKQLTRLDVGKQSLITLKQKIDLFRRSMVNKFFDTGVEIGIDSIIDTLDQGWSPKCHDAPAQSDNEWAVIKTTAIQSGLFIGKENKRLPLNLKPRPQHELKVGDLLVTRAGPRVRVGVCCMVKQTRPRLLNCDKAYRIRVNSKVAIPEYVELLLNSPKCSQEIERLKTGISDSGLNLTQDGFKRIKIRLPDLPGQRRILAEMNLRLPPLDRAEKTINTSLSKLEQLRKSILKSAFDGSLI